MPTQTTDREPTQKQKKAIIWQQAKAMMREGVPGKTPLLELPGVKNDQKMIRFIATRMRDIIDELLDQVDSGSEGHNIDDSKDAKLNQLITDTYDELTSRLKDHDQIKPILGGMCRISVEATKEFVNKRPRIPVPKKVASGLGISPRT